MRCGGNDRAGSGGCGMGPEYTAPPGCPPAGRRARPARRPPPMPTRSSFPSPIPSARGRPGGRRGPATTSASSAKSRSAGRQHADRRHHHHGARGQPDDLRALAARHGRSRAADREHVAVDASPGGGPRDSRPGRPLGRRAVFKELEDIVRPEQATAGAATFRYDSSLTRHRSIRSPASRSPRAGSPKAATPRWSSTSSAIC